MNVKRIVVGVDGSPGSARTLEWLASAFKGAGAEVVAVHCLPPLVEDLFALPPFDFDQWRRDSVEAFRTRWCAPLREAGIEYRTRVVEFDPDEGLQLVADEEDADLIVVGSHGHRHLARGSVPVRLLGHATRPLVVVPTSPGR